MPPVTFPVLRLLFSRRLFATSLQRHGKSCTKLDKDDGQRWPVARDGQRCYKVQRGAKMCSSVSRCTRSKIRKDVHRCARLTNCLRKKCNVPKEMVQGGVQPSIDRCVSPGGRCAKPKACSRKGPSNTDNVERIHFYSSGGLHEVESWVEATEGFLPDGAACGALSQLLFAVFSTGIHIM